METKSLLFGLIGFFIGGLLVSVTATAFDKPEPAADSMSQMTSNLQSKTGDEFDKAFISEMIVHHEGAVEMAKLVQNRAKHQEIKDLSKEIIAAQTSEITMMKDWQMDWKYGVSEESMSDSGH